MSDESQPGSSPFGPGFDLSRLFGLLGSGGDGPVNWEVAREVADWTTTGETTATEEPPIADTDARQFADLATAAQTAVVAETGLSAALGTGTLSLGPRRWARLNLDTLRPVLETLATTLTRDGFGIGVDDGAGDGVGDDTAFDTDALDPELAEQLGALGLPADALNAGQLGQMLEMIAPALLGVQAGSMIGHLATHAFGQYDLPLPVTGEPRLLFVVPNLDAFENDWSLSRDDLRFYVALHEVAHAATRSVPWVRSHLIELANEFVSGYRMDPDALESAIDGEALDPTDPSTLSAALGDPQRLLDTMRTPGQDETLSRLADFTGVLEGYADLVIEGIGEPLIPQFAQIQEAMRRHRVERGEAERFIERLLGLGLHREDYERGESFCRGVVDRAGTDGLHRLWERPDHAPTRAELEAPGLWLARIELDLDDLDDLGDLGDLD